MEFKSVLFVACAVFASANAGIAVTSGSDNTYRSPGNLAQVSTQTKTIDTPYSSSSKSDVRVSNPSVYLSAQPALSYSAHSSPVYASAGPATYENHHAKLAYAAVPQSTVSYASPSPSYSYAAVPVAHTQAYYPQQQHSTYQSYSAPTVYQAPQQVYATAPAAVVAKTTYSAPATYQVAQHAPVAYANPTSYANAAPLAHQPLVKIAYSPASEVAHFTYSNANDHVNYGW